MEKYTKAQMEVIEFENEDVITTSGGGEIGGGDEGFGDWQLFIKLAGCQPFIAEYVGNSPQGRQFLVACLLFV